MSQLKRCFPFVLAFLSTSVLVGCSDDDDDDGAPVPADAEEFSAAMERAQEVPAPVAGTRVRVTLTNRAPDLGTFQTPVWVAFHDGTLDTFQLGTAASTEIERLAEDGNTDPLQALFTAQTDGTSQATLEGELGPEAGPIAPGESVSRVFELDPFAPSDSFFSYASMVIPSNDAFVANDDPQAHPVFDAGGNFIATDFVVTGADVLDAGTEVNDEVPANTGFFGQTTPDTGVDESGVVAVHTGFLPAGSGGILDDPEFTAADFKAVGYEILAVSFDVLPAGPAPVGVVSVTLDPSSDEIDFVVDVSGLSGPATNAHFHEGAPGVAGPPVVDIFGETTINEDGRYRAEGSLEVPDGFTEALRAGNIYVNVHTALNPGGEIRGQLVTDESFSGEMTFAQEVPAPVTGTDVRVTVRNRAPAFGTFQMPVWVGFHDGGFDLYDLGSAADTFFPASQALERLAEDGDLEPLMQEFTDQGFGTVQGSLSGQLGPEEGPIAPGETVSTVFRVDPTVAENRFFSYGTMIIPSNDAFSANGDPIAHPIFDVGGNFVAADFTVAGSEALDAGTEVNDELPANTAFFGQTTPNTGEDEVGGVVAAHAGFLPSGSGGILDDPEFAAADFTQLGYELLEFRFDEVTPGDPPTGMLVASLDPTETQLKFSVVARGLSGPATDMHFHEGAPGVAGPIVIDLGDTFVTNEDGSVTAQGTKPVTPEFLQALRDGEVYLNIHTALNPSGELRGQVILDDREGEEDLVSDAREPGERSLPVGRVAQR